MPRKSFPESRLPEDKPPKRGEIVPGKGKTPLYILAWRLLPRNLVSGPRGGSHISLHDDFVLRWANNVRANPADHILQRPAVVSFFGGLKDDHVYFVAASNNEDPENYDPKDLEYARNALPKIQQWIADEIDVEAGLRWYRRG
uniref:Uncharacterized protein n=1 Tax=Mycena chlorophos TaxID=658473 RepID=A0ABQ0M8Z5_MYCCL|nr:predicted protein [Mycena chlorophos]